MTTDVTRVRCAIDMANRKGLVQRWFSLACIGLVCVDSLLLCMAGCVARHQLFALLCGMIVLFFLAAIRYALAQTGQISRQYRMTLTGWRRCLFDIVKCGTPVFCVVALAVGVVLYFV